MPAEIAVEGVPDGGLFHQLVRRPIVRGGRLTGQGEPAGSPDIDEIGLDAPAVPGDQPKAFDIGRGEVDRVHDDQGEADKLHRPRQPGAGASSAGTLHAGALGRRDFIMRHGGAASLAIGREARQAALKNP
jgi:hypothetical protein